MLGSENWDNIILGASPSANPDGPWWKAGSRDDAGKLSSRYNSASSGPTPYAASAGPEANTIDLDIVDITAYSSNNPDGALSEVVEQWVPGCIPVATVQHMVISILSRTQPGTLRRLRIWGHGSPGVQGVAASSDAARGYRASGSICLQGKSIANATEIALIGPRFAPKGWLELRGCNVAAEESGKQLLLKLSSLLGIPVMGAEPRQVAPRWGGPIWAAFPSGSLVLLKG